MYAIDWETNTRRQNVTVNDGTTSRSANITTAFNNGAWMHFPVNVAAGGTVNITVDRTGTSSAVVSGIFLGGGSNPQGSWVGNYGADGVALGAWNNSASDYVSIPNGSVTMTQGSRYTWATSTTQVRALQLPDQSNRRAATWFDGVQLRMRIDLTAAYSGVLHLYALDWETAGRRENVTVGDGTNTNTINLTTDFTNGRWMNFPISVSAGGTVYITADKTAGNNAVISGLFLDQVGSAPPPPPPTPTPTPTASPTPSATPTPAPTPTPTPTPTAQPTPTATPTPTSTAQPTPSPTPVPTPMLTPTPTPTLPPTPTPTLPPTPTPTLPATVPGQPDLVAAPGAGQVSLSWTTPANGGAGITGYRIYRSTSSGKETLLTTVGLVNGYANTGLTNGTTYWYQVSALNVVGEGAKSAETSAKPVTVPSVPQNFTAASDSLKGINLHWRAPSSNGGSAITGYYVYRGTASGAESLFATIGVVTSYHDTATTKGARYYYVLRAFNAVGTGAPTGEASAIAK